MKTATEIYKGYTIEIYNDEYPQNPFTDWDGNLPLMKCYDRYFEDYSNGDINEYLSEVLRDSQILRHQKELSEVLEIDIEDYEDKFDKISDIRYEIKTSKDFDALETVCILSKTPYLNTCSRGYSQGDYADVFTCYTEKFEKGTGCKKKQIDDAALQHNVDLWGYWAWGDVYGFTIEETDDSCGGFYGDEHEKSGLLEHAKSSIDAEIEHVKEQKAKKLKQLIKAKAPVRYRPRILKQFA